MSITSIRSGLAGALSAISGLRVSAVWPKAVNCPAAIVVPESGDFYQSGSASTALVFSVLFVAAHAGNDYDRAQTALDAYLDLDGAKSVKAAIEADRTLGDTVSDVIVTGWSEYGEIVLNGASFIGCRFNVLVQT